jgi:5-hydroxyisourate hydrolase-like protein (transthyretin family)
MRVFEVSLCAVAVLLLAVGVAVSQPPLSGVLRVRIVDVDTREPAAHARLVLHTQTAGGQDQTVEAQADADGRFRADALLPGTYLVTVTQDQYEGRSLRNVVIEAGQEQHVDVRLSREQ